MLRLSGDQNGFPAPSVPLSCRGTVESIVRSHRVRVAPPSAAANTIFLPSGEIIAGPPSIKKSKAAPGGGRIEVRIGGWLRAAIIDRTSIAVAAIASNASTAATPQATRVRFRGATDSVS